MNNMPRTLLESDIYRVAATGRHVAGWVPGLVKVVQSHSTVNREPRGQYFVLFDNMGAAQLYARRLSVLAKAAVAQADLGPGSTTDADAAAALAGDREAPCPDATPTLLLPPDVPYRSITLSVETLQGVIEKAAMAEAKKKEKQQGGSQLRPLSNISAVPYALGAELAGTSVGERNLLVLVRLTGSKITVPAMQKAVAADGEARNLPWRMLEERPDDPLWPRQVQSLRAGSGKIENQEATRFAYGYTRFVLAFADAAEARRFARTWHRREMLDERTGRTMVVNAHALW
jgi:hypothetical protein